MEQKQILKEAIKEKNIEFLARWYFDIKLSPLQVDLVRKIVFEEYKKISISAMTRWGKSLGVAVSVALYFILNKDKQVVFIAPTTEQSLILRDYLADLVLKCPALLEIADLSMKGEERLRSQTSRSYQTFKNGCSYRVFTAHDKAEGLMGFGVKGILIIDEACQIGNEAYSKIMRMLGDNPEENMLIELYNPWNRDCKAFDHSLDPEYHRIHIGWQDAITDGRTTLEFIETQRKEVTPLEFTVLYESNFPDESEDSIFNLTHIKRSTKDLKLNAGIRIISCDVADKGLDKTVILIGQKDKEKGYVVESVYSEAKSENVNVAGRINRLILNSVHSFEEVWVHIDSIGVGVGVLSIVREFVQQNRLGNVKVIGCHFGENPILEPDRFQNMKAMQYFRLRELFEKDQISVIECEPLVKELISMKWKFNSKSKIQVVDPDKSPDYSDALVYFTWFAKPQYNPIIEGVVMI